MNPDLLETNFRICPEISTTVHNDFRRLFEESSHMSDVTLVKELGSLLCQIANGYTVKKGHFIRKRSQLTTADLRLVWVVVVVCLAPSRSEVDLQVGLNLLKKSQNSYRESARLLSALMLRAFRSQDRLVVIAKGEFFSHVLKHRNDFLELPEFVSKHVFGMGFDRFVRTDDPTGITLSRELREGVLKAQNQSSSQPRSSVDSAR